MDRSSQLVDLPSQAGHEKTGKLGIKKPYCCALIAFLVSLTDRICITWHPVLTRGIQKGIQRYRAIVGQFMTCEHNRTLSPCDDIQYLKPVQRALVSLVFETF